MLTAALLAAVMPGLSEGEAASYVTGANQALDQIDGATALRASMFLAQVGEESGSLRFPTEEADGTEYENRPDLGNVNPGDGPRFKGRGFIQITGRFNYGAFSQWAYARHMCPDPNYFVTHPEVLATGPWVWTGAVWFWSTHNLNQFADAADVEGCTRVINGGYNGLADRQARYATARQVLAHAFDTPEATTGDEMYELLQDENGAVYMWTGSTCAMKSPAQAQVLKGSKLCVGVRVVKSAEVATLRQVAHDQSMATAPYRIVGNKDAPGDALLVAGDSYRAISAVVRDVMVELGLVNSGNVLAVSGAHFAAVKAALVAR